MNDQGRGDGPQQLGELLAFKRLVKRIKGPTPIQQRLLDAAANQLATPEEQREILYQHTIFCQTCLPHRNPGDAVRVWERQNGDVHMRLSAGAAMDPKTHRFVDVGLPYGPKCRLVLMHLNQQAILTQQRTLEVDDSLTAFVRRILKLDTDGRTIRSVKHQLTRLSTTEILLGTVINTQAGSEGITRPLHIVDGFSVWLPKDAHQRILWPSTIDLSETYFEALLSHAVPLAEDHIRVLTHNALALDIYAWLAQRLHRIDPAKPVTISWAALHGQFGQTYTGEQAVKNFRNDFREALKQVLAIYRAARVDDPSQKPIRVRTKNQQGLFEWHSPPAPGLTLRHSKPPVPYRLKLARPVENPEK